MPTFRLGDVTPKSLPGNFVASTATLIGDVALEADASVWFGAVLRGDIEPIRIGERSNIQDLCMLHTDAGYPLTVGPDCTIGHSAILHGCSIGAGTLIGMGAIVLSGASIGEGCLIGAGALIPERKTIPPGSLVLGSPGKPIRVLAPDEIDGLKRSAERYVERGRRYLTDLAEASL